ncbi:MAG: hypothetical protein AB7O81_06165 [Blastocatellales bacterium]
MYDYQAGACKYFPVDDVRISPDVKSGLLDAKRKTAEKPVVIGDFAFNSLPEGSGAVLALAQVGQRDTRWLTPPTVSGDYQG